MKYVQISYFVSESQLHHPPLLISTLVGCRCIVFNRASPLASLKGLRGIANPLTYPLAQKVVVCKRGEAIHKDMLQGPAIDCVRNSQSGQIR